MSDTTIKQTDISPETIVIDPGFELDNNNAHEMVDVIATAQANGYKYVLIDMVNLKFMSSSGVGSILGSVEVSREAGGDIILCNVPEEIKNILQVLDLLDFLTIAPDIESALGRCSANG